MGNIEQKCRENADLGRIHMGNIVWDILVGNILSIIFENVSENLGDLPVMV